MTIAEGPYRDRADTVVHSPPLPPPPMVEPDGLVVGRPVPPVHAGTGGQIRTASASRFAPDAVIAALVGLVMVLFGLIAIIRGGFNGPMSLPVVRVLGFTHTTTLGLLELALGGGLLLSGTSRSRSGEMFFGSVLGIAGFVGAVQTASFTKSLALESSMAWLAVLAAVVVVLAALMLPRFAKRSVTIAPL